MKFQLVEPPPRESPMRFSWICGKCGLKGRVTLAVGEHGHVAILKIRRRHRALHKARLAKDEDWPVCQTHRSLEQFTWTIGDKA